MFVEIFDPKQWSSLRINLEIFLGKFFGIKCRYQLKFASYSRVEKYRPNTLDDLISHKEIINTSEFLFIKK